MGYLGMDRGTVTYRECGIECWVTKYVADTLSELSTRLAI
jgi:hypothetical protein